MNRYKRIFTIVALVLWLCGCHAVVSSNVSNFEKDTIPSNGGYLTQIDEKNHIVIELPLEYSYNAETLQLITEHIESVIRKSTGVSCDLIYTQDIASQNLKWDGVVYTEYNAKINSQYTFCDEGLASIVFEGMINYKSAAHPIHVFFTLNYDPKTNQQVNFLDLYDIDDGVHSRILQAVEEKISSEGGEDLVLIRDYVTNLYPTKEAILKGLSESGEVYAYFTETGVGISLQVPFVLGGHIEVELPQWTLS